MKVWSLIRDSLSLTKLHTKLGIWSGWFDFDVWTLKKKYIYKNEETIKQVLEGVSRDYVLSVWNSFFISFNISSQLTTVKPDSFDFVITLLFSPVSINLVSGHGFTVPGQYNTVAFSLIDCM